MNLLFVFADQWRRDAIGYRGVEDVYTPNIDRFREEAVECTNAISANPLSSPNRAAILTGKYPISTGIWTNCKLGLPLNLEADRDSFGNTLKNNGYNTAYIGKWHLQNPEGNRGKNPKSGAKEWDAYTPPGPLRQGFDFWYSYGADDSHLSPHYWKDTDKQIKVNKWSVEHETDIAIDYILDKKDEKWAMFLSWNPPHTPFDQVPEKYRKLYKDKDVRYRKNLDYTRVRDHTSKEVRELCESKYVRDIKDYYAAISGIDENFARLIKLLKSNSIYEETLIVLTADHGEMLGSHSLWGKHVWYEESIGVPFLLKLGDRYLGKNDTVINGVDIMPTILSMMGIEVPDSIEGRDLKGSFEEQEIENYGVVSSYPGKVEAIKTFEKRGLDSLAYGWRAIRSRDYLYVYNRGYEYGAKVEEYFYDLKSDPYQLGPLDDDVKVEEREKHKDTLKLWIKKYGDKFEF